MGPRVYFDAAFEDDSRYHGNGRLLGRCFSSREDKAVFLAREVGPEAQLARWLSARISRAGVSNYSFRSRLHFEATTV